MKPLIRLNLGCGEKKLDGFVNIDSEKKTKPDLLHNFAKLPLPFKPDSVDEIACIHNIEHLKFSSWQVIFTDWYRVLKPKARLILEYPEFEVCAKYYVENHRGLRDFWRNCLYGRQLYPSDTHISPIITKELVQILKRIGFVDIKHMPVEEPNPQYTFLTCVKGTPVDKESVLKDRFFKNHIVVPGRFKKK